MYKRYIVLVLLVLTLTLIGCIVGCKSNPSAPENHPPVVQSVTANPSTVAPGDSSTVTAVATDQDGDQLTYTWQATGGTFPQGATGASVLWVAPNETGVETVTVTVNDGKATDSKGIPIAISSTTGTVTGYVYETQKTVSPGKGGEIETKIAIFDTDVSKTEYDKDGFSSKESKFATPIQGAVVSIGSVVDTSNSSGYYNLEDVPTGPQTIYASKSGYENYSDTLTVTTGINNYNIYMTSEINPILWVVPTSLDFGDSVDTLFFTISNIGDGTLSWSINDNQNWLNCIPTSGSSTTETDTIATIVDRTGLSPNTYNGKVYVTSNGGDDTVNVVVQVIETATVLGHTYYSGTTIPVSGVLVAIGSNSYTTSSDGYYELTDVPTGQQNITATKVDYDPYSQTIDVPHTGLFHNINMTSGYYTHSVYGTVTCQVEGTPIFQARVALLNPDSSESDLWTTTSGTGYYQIPMVPQGNGILRFSHTMYNTFYAHIYLYNTDLQYDLTLVPRRNIEISGHIVQNETWKRKHSPYIMVGDVFVDNGVTLMIQADVTVKTDSGFGMYITGTLVAQGNSVCYITFTSNLSSPSGGSWNGLYFDSIASSTSTIDHCIIEYAGPAIQWTNPNYGITISNSYIRHNKTTVQNKIAGGIVCRNNCNVINNAIYDNEGPDGGAGGVYKGIVENNFIYSNMVAGVPYWPGGGCAVSWAVRVANNVITGHKNFSSSDHSYVIENHYGEVTHNIISGNGMWRRLQYALKGDGTNNIISNNGLDNNAIPGAGINGSGDYNNLYGNSPQDYSNWCSPGPHDISADPLFVNPNYADPMNGDWHLQSGSPCIGTGENGTDIGLLDPDNIGPQ